MTPWSINIAGLSIQSSMRVADPIPILVSDASTARASSVVAPFVFVVTSWVSIGEVVVAALATHLQRWMPRLCVQQFALLEACASDELGGAVLELGGGGLGPGRRG